MAKVAEKTLFSIPLSLLVLVMLVTPAATAATPVNVQYDAVGNGPNTGAIVPKYQSVLGIPADLNVWFNKTLSIDGVDTPGYNLVQLELFQCDCNEIGIWWQVKFVATTYNGGLVIYAVPFVFPGESGNEYIPGWNEITVTITAGHVGAFTKAVGPGVVFLGYMSEIESLD